MHWLVAKGHRPFAAAEMWLSKENIVGCLIVVNWAASKLLTLKLS
jgi:hypothetical protein